MSSEPPTTGRILLIDPSTIARRKVRLALEAVGHEVLELDGPMGAARAILRHAPQVVVMELPMTDLLEAEEVVRACHALEDSRLLLFSARSREELSTLADSLGAAFVEKTSDDSILVTEVARLISGEESQPTRPGGMASRG